MEAASAVERVFREQSGAVLATLIRLTGSFQLAEDAFGDALESALERWPVEGTPRNPAAWITTTARRKAIDRLRRARASDRGRRAIEADEALRAVEAAFDDPPAIPDDQLRLIFTCCHPALSLEAQIALTLRTLAGLTTQEIARAFLLPEPTMAQRLVRAKKKIESARIPYRIPEREEMPERLAAVLAVLYLVFNEGYFAGSGDDVVRRDLCKEAIRLCRILVALMEDETEARGLLALMLLHDARSEARASDSGALLLLDEQDRTRWNLSQIAEGISELERALFARRPGPYQIQAAIAALHAEAKTAKETDWPQIAALYRELHRLQPSPIVRLNGAVAVSYADGPEVALAMLEGLEEPLDGYLGFHVARADLLGRLGRIEEAHQAYDRAIALCDNAQVRSHLERKRGGA